MSDARYQDSEYMVGMQRKLASLDSDRSGLDVDAMSGSPLWARHNNRQRSLKCHALFALPGVVASVVAIMASAVVSRVVAKTLF